MKSQMIKSLKKLKIWARKNKRQKKTQVLLDSVTGHPHITTHCCSCSLAQPSAPPLPPWLDEQTYYAATSATASSRVFDEHWRPQDHAQLSDPEIASEEVTPLPAAPSYQQYTVTTPIYSLPIVPDTPREKCAGFFGCAITVGTTLIRCFCPCFSSRNLNCKL
ncbi:hypothetical protein Sjap_018950 [Stephania japonica]|uniref:Uncharacterized protein n=1 Tax=Stephania japonica TaxID=461633 RepID=A0AAP0EZ33_9MAGN